jgi:Ca2+-transporting ATPase
LNTDYIKCKGAGHLDWHLKDTEECFNSLGSSPDGLSSGEAVERLQKYGPNELIETAGKSLFAMFLDQFKDFMILVLIAAAVVSGLMGEVADTTLPRNTAQRRR